MQICFYLIFFMFFCQNTQAAQRCQPASIPASTPDSQLVDNGNGTINDRKTGLMWKKCVEGLSGNTCETGDPAVFNWQQALEQPRVINSGAGFAGYHDWRLPNIKELISILEEQCYGPAINLNRFPRTFLADVWSSSPYVRKVILGSPYPMRALAVNFNLGQLFILERTRRMGEVRLVRDEQ